jgi:hypothetical protein
METIKDYFGNLLTDSPEYFGIFFVGVGLFFLLAAIYDWNWLFGDVNKLTYNLKKYDGWINLFGRKGRIAARIHLGAGGVIAILGGIFLFWLYGFFIDK